MSLNVTLGVPIAGTMCACNEQAKAGFARAKFSENGPANPPTSAQMKIRVT